jgi:cytochrome bd ubiquinol oxidase subunit I
MVGIGLLMIAIGLVGAWLWARGRLFETRWYLRAVAAAWPLGFIAILAGWWVTETGRQPWIAYGILRTADAVSPVTFNAVLTTLVLFVLIYTSVFSVGVYYINRLINKGPSSTRPEGESALPSRPLSAATDSTRSAIAPGE